MILIPVPFTVTTPMTPEQAMQRLRHQTDTKHRPFWHPLLAGFGRRNWTRIFYGHIEAGNLSFHLLHLQSDRSVFPTAYKGRIERDGAQTSVKVWLWPSVGPVIILMAFAVILSGDRLLPWLFPPHPHSTSGLTSLLIIGAVILVIGEAVKLSRARRLFITLLGAKSGQQPDGLWPEVGNLEYQVIPGGFQSEAEEMSHARELVEEFLAYATRVLNHPTTPPHSLQVAGDRQSLTLTFPARSQQGFEVRASIDKSGLKVWAGKLAHIPPVAGESLDETARISLGMIRDLLSPACRLRERYAGSILYWAAIDARDLKDEWNELFDNRVSGKKPDGPRTEKIFLNTALPRRDIDQAHVKMCQ